jgi:hypothetical protein
MTIIRIQAAIYGTAPANNIAVSFPIAPKQGNLLVAWVMGVAGTDAAIIPGWSLAVDNLLGAESTHLSILYKIAEVAESKDVIATMTASTTTKMVIEEWSGLSSSNPLDQTAFTVKSYTTSKSSGTTVPLSIGNQLCIAGWGLSGVGGTGQSYTNGFTEEFSQDFGATNFFGASKVAMDSAAQECTLAWTTMRNAGGVIATFIGFSDPANRRTANSIGYIASSEARMKEKSTVRGNISSKKRNGQV